MGVCKYITNFINNLFYLRIQLIRLGTLSLMAGFKHIKCFDGTMKYTYGSTFVLIHEQLTFEFAIADDDL